MTLTDLRYLIALAETGDMEAAAKRCQTSLPTLSVALKKLEESLKLSLFERDESSVILTPDGRQVVERAQRVLFAAHEISEFAESESDPLTQTFALGSLPCAASYLYPALLPALIEKAPDMPLCPEQGGSEQLLRKLREGLLDAIIIERRSLPEDLSSKTLLHEQLSVLLPASHRLARNEQLTQREIANYPVLSLNAYHSLSAHIERHFPKLSATEHPHAHKRPALVQADSLTTLQYMVASGLGISIIPSLAADAALIERYQLSLRPLLDDNGADGSQRELVLAWRPGFKRSVVIDLVLQCAQQIIDA